MSIYYIVYRTTNTLNGKIYIGAHKSINEYDDYLGSGTLLKKAINKHGIDNFTRENLFYCVTEEEMFQIESILVDKEFVERKDTYNMIEGGLGWCGLIDYCRSNMTGLYGWTAEQRSNWSKVTQANRDPEERRRMCSEAGKKGSRIAIDNKLGVHGLSKEERVLIAKKANYRLRELGKGIFDPEVQRQSGKKGGAKGKDSIFYNDGSKMYKYSKEQQAIESFDSFIINNPEYNPGRLNNASKCSEKKWVNDGITNKRINQDELDKFLEDNKSFTKGKTKCNEKTKFVTNGSINKRLKLGELNEFLNNNKDFRLGCTKSKN